MDGWMEGEVVTDRTRFTTPALLRLAKRGETAIGDEDGI